MFCGSLRKPILAAIVALVAPIKAVASPITINFDSLSDGAAITTQFSGFTFSNAIALTAGISLNEFEFPPHSGSTVASDDGAPIRIDFAQPASYVGGYFTYAEPLTLRAYDAANVLLGTTSSLFSASFVSSGNPSNEFIELAINDISYVTITGDSLGGSFVLDDFVSETRSVPEPSALVLLLVGMSGIVLFQRKTSGK